MKKTFLAGILLIGSAAGCFSLPHQKNPPQAPAATVEPLPSSPITAEQVEAANAHRVAEAIWDEMDREQQQDTASKDAKKR